MGRECEKFRPKLKTPYAPEESEHKVFFENNSANLKIVSDYTLMNFMQVLDTEIFEYFGYLHDAVVWNCEKSESGREYLESAYNHGKTEPDRKGLREWQTKSKA